jgi:glycosyltransferase involved in cell wall biosynthesis
MARATVFVYPSYAEGFGLPILEALSFGVPVVHSDDPALVEVAGGVGVVVPRLPFPEFCPAIARAVGMSLSNLGEESAASDRRARARAFSWRRSAASIWSVHLALTTQGKPGG